MRLRSIFTGMKRGLSATYPSVLRVRVDTVIVRRRFGIKQDSAVKAAVCFHRDCAQLAACACTAPLARSCQQTVQIMHDVNDFHTPCSRSFFCLFSRTRARAMDKPISSHFEPVISWLSSCTGRGTRQRPKEPLEAEKNAHAHVTFSIETFFVVDGKSYLATRGFLVSY